MNPNFIIDFWPYWIAGLIIFPLILSLLTLPKIRTAVNKGDEAPKEVAKLFLTPGTLFVTLFFGVSTFVCLILFLASVLIGMIAGIRNLF